MLKILKHASRHLAEARRRLWVQKTTSWARDPMSHPALRIMSPRELGDLPFELRRPVSCPEKD